jgi:hypothetical protein
MNNKQYVAEAEVFTLKALNELKEFCLSNQCNKFTLMMKVKHIKNLASFIEGESQHFSDLINNSDKQSENEDEIDMEDDLNDDDNVLSKIIKI